MIRRILLFAALAACHQAVKRDAVDPGADLITRQMQELNAHGKPTHELRPGTVTPRAAPPIKKTAHGFEVQFGNGSAVSTPAVYDGKIYSSGGFNSREFYAFDARTGQSSFALDLSDDGPSAPACADGTCVFNTESCTTFAIDAKTGKLKWAWFLGDPQTSSPTIANGRVFTSYPAGGAEEGSKPDEATHVLAAFDLQTGKVLWQDWLSADVISAPVAVGEFVYVALFDGTVIKMEQATGHIRYATKGRATSAPVVEIAGGLESMYYTRRADDDSQAKHRAREEIIRTDHNEPKTKYHSNAKDADYLDDDTQDKSAQKTEAAEYDSKNGFSGGAPASAAAYKAKANVGVSNVSSMQQFQGSRILHMQQLNVNTMGDEVIGSDPEDGKQLWSHKLEGDVKHEGGSLGTPPIAAGKHVVLATLHGTVIEIDPKSGKTEQTFEVGGRLRNQPVVDHGWIYVGTDDGRLVAIDTGDRGLDGWPMWGGNAARTGEVPQ
jgi:outer membrane protein assembly factor BamB